MVDNFRVRLNSSDVSISDLEDATKGLVVADGKYDVGWRRFDMASVPISTGAKLSVRLRGMVEEHPEWLQGDKGGIYADVIKGDHGAGIYGGKRGD